MFVCLFVYARALVVMVLCCLVAVFDVCGECIVWCVRVVCRVRLCLFLLFVFLLSICLYCVCSTTCVVCAGFCDLWLTR